MQSVIVEGAGVIGLSRGYHLALKGLDVTIVEENLPGVGQSTKTGGGIRYFHGSHENVQMSFASQEFWKKFHETFDIDPQYQKTGHLFLTSNSEVSQNLYGSSNHDDLKLERLKYNVDGLIFPTSILSMAFIAHLVDTLTIAKQLQA